MVYTEKHFTNCMFNPLVETPIIEAYPRLAEIIDTDWPRQHIDILLRYTICVYDPKSPLVINERDLNYRKGLAAELAGFDLGDTEFVQSVFDCSHDFGGKETPIGAGFVDLVIKFLIRFIKSKEFAAICIVESCFWESAKKLMEPITGKNSKEELEAVQKKSAIKDEIDKDIARLDRYQKAFFGEDDELEIAGKARMSPESVGKLSNKK